MEQVNEVRDLVVRAEGLMITTQGQYEGANDFLKVVKGIQKQVKESFDPIIQKANDAHKEAIAKRDEHLQPLKDAEATIKRIMIAYDTEQRKKAEELQLKLEREAQRKADEEKARKEEQERQWREKAKQLEAEGNPEGARKALEKADQRALESQTVEMAIVPVIAQPQAPKGASYREQWSAEVVDISLVPREYMVVNQQALDKIAMATKGTIQIPGVKFVSKTIMSSR
uniref:Uncharacterized protein n=1 Tax=viral metagenome TaxID=1070528 RepID=A0A6H1Z7J1_9ZZZZ